MRTQSPARTFTNRIMMPLLFLDELESLKLWPLWSSRFRTPIRWSRKDFFGDPDIPLADAVRAFVKTEAGFETAGPVAMLGHHRTWGWLFNPIVVYYCFACDETTLEAVVASVSNTPWGENHNYVIDTRDGFADLPLQPKALHVSPFLPMDLAYRFRLTSPTEKLAFSVSVLKDESQVFRAGMTLRRVPLSRWNLLRTLVLYPLQTFRVSEGIYREAVVLAFRKAKFYTHPRKQL